MRAQRSLSESAPAPFGTARGTGLWLFLGLLGTLCSPSLGHAASLPRPHRQPKQIVHIIEQLERQWRQAELHANTTVMASMLSDDYLGIYGDGTLATKAETLADAKNGSVHFTQIDTSDRKIRVYGTTAVVVSKAQVAGTIDGTDISGTYRYTRVYHRVDGTWKIVSFEASNIKERKPTH